MEQPVIIVFNYVDVMGSFCYTATYVTKRMLHMCCKLYTM